MKPLPIEPPLARSGDEAGAPAEESSVPEVGSPLASGAPPSIDAERLFEALSFLGEDDILADGSLWKVKEIAINAAAEYERLGR